MNAFHHLLKLIYTHISYTYKFKQAWDPYTGKAITYLKTSHAHRHNLSINRLVQQSLKSKVFATAVLFAFYAGPRQQRLLGLYTSN
jgi:hypothetical protein